MRWRQVYNEEKGKYELVPVDAAAQRADGHSIHGDIETFRSPIDGTIISDRKQLREHNERHGVVQADEFSSTYYKEQAGKRADFFQGRKSTEEKFKIRQQIHEIIERAERNG
jgi:hypothetical protein